MNKKNIHEPCIMINGKMLTSGESMTIRVAIESFALTLKDGLGDDKLGNK